MDDIMPLGSFASSSADLNAPDLEANILTNE